MRILPSDWERAFMEVAAALSSLKPLDSDWRSSASAVLCAMREAFKDSSLACSLLEREPRDWEDCKVFISLPMSRMAFCSSTMRLMFCSLVPMTASISAASSS